MRTHLTKSLALLLAFVLVLGLLPTGPWSIRAQAAEEKVYILDATTDAEAMASNTKADGDTLVLGTEGYFTLICAAKTKIDSSSKDFSDGYSGTQRINFQAATDLTTKLPAIRFTTAAAASIKLWWVSGGNGRQFAILDENGNELTRTTDDSAKNSLYISQLQVDAAGTYYLAVPDGSNNLFKMEVTEQAAPVQPDPEAPASNEHAFAASSLIATADKEMIPEGALTADGYFTIIGEVTKRTEKDGTTVKSVELKKNAGGAIAFTLTGNAQVVIEMSSTGSSNTSAVALLNGAGEAVANKEGITEVTTTSKTTLSYSLEAGTYRIVSPESEYGRGARVYTVTVTEQAAATSEHSFAASSLTATADKEVIPEGALTADGYFTIIGEVTKRTEKDGTTVKSVELKKNAGGAIAFTLTGNAQVVIEMSSTGGSNTSAVALLNGAGEAVANKEGITEVTTTSKTTLSYSLEAGTYRIVSPESEYGRGARVYTISVTETTGQAPARTPWDSVELPAVTAVVQNGNQLEVTVHMPIGYNGADSLTLSMLSADGVELKSSTLTAEGDAHIVSFSPVSSGTYLFRAIAKRTEEADKPAVEDFSAAFVLPLAVPTVVLVHNEENGGLTAVWTDSREATGYEVTCTAPDGTVLTETTSSRSFTFSGLTVGQEYTLAVTAIRGEERSAASSPVTVTATQEAKTSWNFTRYGDSTNDEKNGYSVNEDGTVTVWSEGGKGKVQPTSTDGLAFYYTAVPTTHNFTLRAKVHVDSWLLSNGQEGFGLLATDRLGPNGDATSFWNNQYMLGLTKIEYKWDADAETWYPIDHAEGIKFSMKLGLGAIAKTGLTQQSLAYALTMPDGFVSESVPLDFTATVEAFEKGTYNIVGNYTSPVDGTLAEMTDFVLEITKNNTGYFVTYYDAEGNVVATDHNWDPTVLNQLDSEFVYVGFFASRNVRATYEVLEFSTIAAEDDAPAQEKPVEKITPSVAIGSATTTQSTAYDLTFMANVAGKVSIRIDDRNTDLKDIPVQANQKNTVNVPVTADGITKLAVIFTPDPEQDLGEGKVLSGTGTVGATIEVTHTSLYEGRENLYVAPNGYSTGDGSLAKPLDIYTAVDVVRPGQTIVLLEGTYLLERTVKIQRGINGTEEKPIRMVADPAAKTRPVLDFQGLCAGIVHGGDWWFFYGFDVTRAQDGQKGFQVSGNHNVLDNLHTYYNGNSGIQISRYSGTFDLDISSWPSYNLILNCTSWGNADAGYEDADGFAAKLTCGEGNVFDGCVAHHNADDGWDLYAKVETGPIGAVTIRNCVAYANGYLEDGTIGGNGNGFKMGGSSISGKHKLINSYAFFNKAKGIDSNSGPDIIVENCTTYNNNSYNVAFYTNIEQDTAFVASGIISFKDGEYAAANVGENLKPRGTQNEAAYKNDTCYYWDGAASQNHSGAAFTADMFLSTEFKGIARNADGTVDMQGFLALADSAPANAGARMTGTASNVVTLNNPDQPQQGDDPVVDPTEPTNPVEPTTPAEPTQPSQPTEPVDPPVDDTPKSGAAVWIILVVLAVAAVAVVLYLKKKKN